MQTVLIVHTGESGPVPGDEEIRKQAHREKRILVTLDKDFGSSTATPIRDISQLPLLL